MRLRVDTSSLRETRWYEPVIRFATGGAVTVLAGLIAKRWGAAVGGLFLAFPAIFAASVTLVEKHQNRREVHGPHRGDRGRRAASVEAAGAAMASLGLAAFALCVWQLVERWPAPATLAAATAVWVAVSGGIRFLRRFVHRLAAKSEAPVRASARQPAARRR